MNRYRSAIRHGIDLARVDDHPSGYAAGILGTGKRPDYRTRPDGAGVWIAAAAILVALELFALITSRTVWTLSRTVWWLLDHEYTLRWWLTYPLLAALLIWAVLHFGWPHHFGGAQLAAMAVIALALGVVGALAT